MTLSQPDSEVSEEPDFLLAAQIFNRQEAKRSDLQLLMVYGPCPAHGCKAPRRGEAWADKDSITFGWAVCESCGYDDLES